MPVQGAMPMPGMPLQGMPMQGPYYGMPNMPMGMHPMMLPQATARLPFVACEHFNADIGLAACREEQCAGDRECNLQRCSVQHLLLSVAVLWGRISGWIMNAHQRLGQPVDILAGRSTNCTPIPDEGQPDTRECYRPMKAAPGGRE